MLSLKKNSFSRLSGSNLDLRSPAIRPAEENKRSTSVDVGGAVKNFLGTNNQMILKHIKTNKPGQSTDSTLNSVVATFSKLLEYTS